MSEPAALEAAAMQQFAAVLDELTAAQLEDLVAGRGRLVFRANVVGTSRPRRAATPADAGVTGAVEEINGLTTPTEVADYLHRRRFTTRVLKEIARALGPTVSTASRSKADLTRDIVEGTAGFRTRSAAMSGGAWA